jgi:hypothetical protein
MRNKYAWSILLCAGIAFATAATAQDRIYLQRDTREGRVVDITADEVKCQERQDGAITAIARHKVLVVFNHTGHFLVVPKLTDSLQPSQQLIKDFVNASAPVEPTDQLITRQNQVINCNIEKENKRKVQYVSTRGGPQQINKSELAAIIYKDGTHKIMDGIKNAIDPLTVMQIRSLSRYKPEAPAEQKKEVIAVPSVETTTVASTIPTSSAVQPATAPDTLKQTATAMPAGIGGMGAAKPGSQYIEELGEVKFEEYERKALAKTNDLKVYIQQLCDKTLEWIDADKFIDMAVGLFIKVIQYDKVEIEWTNVQYVSKLRKGPDGNYYGVISFEQVFKGYSGDNQLQYSDVTRKNIEVILKTYDKYVDGKAVPTWDVFLSEIKVISTKA